MSLMDRLAENVRNRVPVEVATVIAGPRSLGAKILVYLDGNYEGELGLDGLDAQIAGDAVALLRVERAESRNYLLPDAAEGESIRVFFEHHVPPPTLIIVGAGHTSIPLAAMAQIAGFSVTLIDARAAFASHERFRNVDEIIVDWPHKVLADRPLTSATYVAVLTHDPKFEEPLLPILLRSDARYIGVIGSRKTQIERRERLLASGFSESDLQRLSGPIGLDLGAVTPEEIAVSILAEIIARQHGRSGGFLSDKLAFNRR
jgi:xanthine dehydrogenase accessory factor